MGDERDLGGADRRLPALTEAEFLALSPRRTPALTEAEFLALSPRRRGYVVRVLGRHEDQPNVPDEACPYPRGSGEAAEWHLGRQLASRDLEEGVYE